MSEPLSTSVESAFPSISALGDNIVKTANVGDENSSNLQISSPIEEQYKEFFDYSLARQTLTQIRDSWKPEVVATDGRRKFRDIEIDVQALRESGEIKEDETFIPVRIVDVNIQREQPSYVNYLRNSRRIAIFDCKTRPNQDVQLLEQSFTKVCTYAEWEKPHFKTIDGTQTHAWDSVEAVLDMSKPGHVALEHIGHDKLFFSYDAIHLQNCSRVLRAFDLTIQQLKEFVRTFGFDEKQVNTLIEARQKAGEKEERTIRVFKCFYKVPSESGEGSCVYVAWFSLDYGTSDWLKKPTKLFLGRRSKVTTMVSQMVMNPLSGMPTPQMTPQESWQDTDEPNYPIFILPYRETEKQKITDHKGRCFLDGGKQEAHTAVLTGFVNGITRASNVYASPEVDVNDGGPLKVADVKLVNGAIMTKPMRFFHLDYPDPMVLRALQYMDSHNAQEVGDVNFAALNRPDSRKTATELTQAQGESQKLDSVQLTLFSTYIRQVYGFVWLIVQSQALQGLLPNFLLVQQADGSYIQDIDTISQTYDIRAAGDVDVIQKIEMVTQMQNDWPVVQQTSLAMTFLVDLLKLKYPNDASRYEMILIQGDPKVQLIMELGQALLKIVNNPQVSHLLTPQDKMQLQQLEAQAQQVLQPQAPQPQNSQSSKPTGPPPENVVPMNQQP